MPRNKRIGFKAKDRFKKIMDRFIDGLGRDVFVYLTPTRSECPNCYYDSRNNRSSGIPKVDSSSPTYFITGRCPVCYGKGVLTTSRRKKIHALVIWDPSGEGLNTLTFTEAGYEGATKVQIKTDPIYHNYIKNSEYMLIDGLKCKLSNPPILRGVGSKSVLVAEFFTTEKLSNLVNETI